MNNDLTYAAHYAQATGAKSQFGDKFPEDMT